LQRIAAESAARESRSDCAAQFTQEPAKRSKSRQSFCSPSRHVRPIGGLETIQAKEMTMSIKTKMALAAALILGSASAGFAQVVPEVDGDGNATGLYDVLPQVHSAHARGHRAHGSIAHSFAGPRHHVAPPVYYYGANGPEWERNFERWLQQD
jgi:hypothetical protein